MFSRAEHLLNLAPCPPSYAPNSCVQTKDRPWFCWLFHLLLPDLPPFSLPSCYPIVPTGAPPHPWRLPHPLRHSPPVAMLLGTPAPQWLCRREVVSSPHEALGRLRPCHSAASVNPPERLCISNRTHGTPPPLSHENSPMAASSSRRPLPLHALPAPRSRTPPRRRST
jgi:hypothetical protein